MIEPIEGNGNEEAFDVPDEIESGTEHDDEVFCESLELVDARRLWFACPL